MQHQEHIFAGEPDEDLIKALEPDQLFVAVHRPLPRRTISPQLQAALWALRIFLLAVTAMVVYVFVVGVVRGAG